MATTCSSCSFRIAFVSPREDLSVLSQGVGSVIWPNGEDGRETELQLLASHSLKRNLEVERADGYDGVLLPWVDESFLHNVDVRYATSSDHNVRICIRNVITHGEEALRFSD